MEQKNNNEKKENLYQSSIKYHSMEPKGKLEIIATKPLGNHRDLSLAYSPGVSGVCELIEKDPNKVYDTTAKGNLLAVISNGTAVLGLGNIGPLASKPVMEGKAVLFKKFAGINVFDLEVNETDIDKFVDIVAALEPTFGGINLEDIKAPDCFEIEKRLIEKLKIPVFHDDQHGTAIVATAALINSLQLCKKKIQKIKIVCSGAGAAANACLNMFIDLGVNLKNIILCDSKGVVYDGREGVNKYKQKFSKDTSLRTLKDAIVDADVFLGVSVGNTLTTEMLKTMASKPIVFALANPYPEIMPDIAKSVRDDLIIATGRSDFANQVNNVLCFPYIFRGALDVQATQINTEMKLACAHAIANIARLETLDEIQKVYNTSKENDLLFGPELIIPKPFDPRLMIEIAPVVAKAAMDTGVARKPIENLEEYKTQLKQIIYPSNAALKQILIQSSSKDYKKITFSDGENQTVLQVVQNIVDEGIKIKPILIGRRSVVELYIKRMNYRIKIDEDFELTDPENDPRFKSYHELYYQLTARKGVSQLTAKQRVRTRPALRLCKN